MKADLTTTRGLSLEYDTFGDPKNAPMVLIMGLRSQMVHWRPEFCEKLAEKGYYVVRFDNRDCGLSTYFDHLGTEPILTHCLRKLVGLNVVSKYTLDDMAADTMALMDYLKIEKAHILGVSMGGMIAQLCALNYPDRVLSLTSVMSNTGSRSDPGPVWSLRLLLLRPRPTDFEGVYKLSVALYRELCTPEMFEMYRKDIEQQITESLQRDMRLDGGRQLAAILAAPDRRKSIGGIKCPTLVIHGTHDPMLPCACGVATAKAIPGARLLLIHNMGHSLPPHNWDEMIHGIVSLKQSVAA